MPMMAGRVGAIHAAHRRSRDRTGSGNGNSFNPPPRASASKTASSSPVEDAIGKMAWLKKQVQEKVESGLKMISSGTKDPEKDKREFHKDGERRLSSTSLTADRAPPPQDSARSDSSANRTMLPAAWITTLSEMGFDRAQAMDAVAMIGGKPAELGDLLEVLVAMNASPTASDAAADAAASSCQDRDSESTSLLAGCKFSITLDKVPGTSLGIEVRLGKDKVLIESIRNGLMTDWNTQNPDLQVEAGDQIVGINGNQCSAQELVALLQGTSTLEISMLRETCCESMKNAYSENTSSSSLTNEPNEHPSDHLACAGCREEVKDADPMDAPAIEEDEISNIKERLASGLTQALHDGLFEKYLATQSDMANSPATNLESVPKHEPEVINSSLVSPMKGGA